MVITKADYFLPHLQGGIVIATWNRVALFCLAGLLVFDAASANFNRVPGPPGGMVTYLAATKARQFLATEDGLHSRAGTEGPWIRTTVPELRQLITGIHTLGDTVVVQGQGIHLSPDNGTTWQVLSNPGPPQFPMHGWSIVHFGQHGLFLNSLPDFPGIVRTRDFGKTWEAFGSVDISNGVEWDEGLVFARHAGGADFFDPVTGTITPMDQGLPTTGNPRLYGDGHNLFAVDRYLGEVYRYQANSQEWKLMVDSPLLREDKFRFRNGTAYWGYPDSSYRYRVQRSDDQGLTWTPVAVVAPYAMEDFMPSDTGFFALVGGHGIARFPGQGPFLIPDNLGLQAGNLEKVQAFGDRIFTRLGWPGWIYSSENVGKDWTIVSQENQGSDGSFLQAGTDLFLSEGLTLRRYSQSEGRFDSVPKPLGRILSGMADGGDRFYALGFTPGLRSEVEYFLSSSPKTKLQWTSLSLPDPMVLGVDGHGPDILAFGRARMDWSQDGGMSWHTLTGLPFSTVNQIAYTPDRWLVFSERGIFAAPQPSGPWVHLAFTDKVQLVNFSGRNMVVKVDTAKIFISRDTGSTWSELISPIPARSVVQVSSSDKFLCFGRIGEMEHYCSDLASLPIPVRRRSSEWRRATPQLAFEGTWKIIRYPTGLAGGPHGLDFLGRRQAMPGMAR